MFVLVPYTEDHLADLIADMRTYDRQFLKSTGGIERFTKYMEQVVKVALVMTMVDDLGDPAAIWVVLGKHNHCVEIQTYTTNLVDEQPRAFFKACQRTLQSFVEIHETPIKRIQAMVAEDYGSSRRWLELLGFKNETPNGMKNYGADGSTYMLYAKTYGG